MVVKFAEDAKIDRKQVARRTSSPPKGMDCIMGIKWQMQHNVGKLSILAVITK